MSQIFTEYKQTYFGKINRFDCELAERKDGEVVLIFKPASKFDFLGISIDSDSLCFGYFWEKRNYNVYHWKSTEGKTIMYYFNISKDTKIGANRVDWLDLIVDVASIGVDKPRILDEDEIPKSMSDSDLSTIEGTKHEIIGNLRALERMLEKKTEAIARRLSLFRLN